MGNLRIYLEMEGKISILHPQCESVSQEDVEAEK
jgi:hypothetical protein